LGNDIQSQLDIDAWNLDPNKTAAEKATKAALEVERNAKRAQARQAWKNMFANADIAKKAKKFFKAGNTAYGKKQVKYIIGTPKGNAALKNKGLDPQNFRNFAEITNNSNVLGLIFNKKFRPTNNQKKAAALLVKNYSQFLSKNQKNALNKLNATRGRRFIATGAVGFRYKQVISNPGLKDGQIKQLLNIKKTSDLNMSTKSSVSDNNLTTISAILEKRKITTPPQSFTDFKKERGLSK